MYLIYTERRERNKGTKPLKRKKRKLWKGRKTIRIIQKHKMPHKTQKMIMENDRRMTMKNR